MKYHPLSTIQGIEYLELDTAEPGTQVGHPSEVFYPFRIRIILSPEAHDARARGGVPSGLLMEPALVTCQRLFGPGVYGIPVSNKRGWYYLGFPVFQFKTKADAIRFRLALLG